MSSNSMEWFEWWLAATILWITDGIMRGLEWDITIEISHNKSFQYQLILVLQIFVGDFICEIIQKSIWIVTWQSNCDIVLLVIDDSRTLVVWLVVSLMVRQAVLLWVLLQVFCSGFSSTFCFPSGQSVSQRCKEGWGEGEEERKSIICYRVTLIVVFTSSTGRPQNVSSGK